MSTLSTAQVQRFYRPLSIVFAVLVIALIVGVAYTGWSSTVITITPLLKPVTTTFSVTISSETASTSTRQLSGTIASEERSATVTATPATDGTPIPAHATGSVIIKNSTATAQPLAAGTRLRSTANVIVRTTARVDVPANGQVTATVVADPLGAEGNVPPGRFVIVALWPALQEKIYGETTSALTGGTRTGSGTLSLDGLTSASKQATDQLRAALGPSKTGTFVTLTPRAVTSTPKIDVPSPEYRVTVKASVTTVTYPDDQLRAMARQELQKVLADGQVLSDIAAPTIALSNHPSSTQAVFEITTSGHAQLSPQNDVLKSSTYVNLSTSEVREKILGSLSVKEVTVRLSPWWRTTTPDRPERITITTLPAKT